MNRRMLTLGCFCLLSLTAISQNYQPLFFENELDTFPAGKVSTIVDSVSLRVQKGNARTHISPYGLTFRLDSTLEGHYPLVILPPEKHPDHVPFLFNLNSTDQLPYTGKNNVMMFGWNLGLGGSAFVPGKPGIGFSLESNFHPGGELNTTWVESHEFYIKPSGQQVRLKSYTIGLPPSEFIDLYHTTDNFHLRSENQVDYFTVRRDNATGYGVLNFSSSNETNVTFGRTDLPQSIQFQIGTDRVNIAGQSKIITIPPTTEMYFDAGAIGGLNTGYGLNIGSGLKAIGEMGNRQILYQFFSNNTSAADSNSAVMCIGSYSGLFQNSRCSFLVYNNGAVTVSKEWRDISGKASMEVGRKSGAKTPLKLDDLPVYPSAAAAIADGLEPGCLYIREGHGLDVITSPVNPLTEVVRER